MIAWCFCLNTGAWLLARGLNDWFWKYFTGYGLVADLPEMTTLFNFTYARNVERR